jgi:polyphosphate kinase 2 (PPK2 family)
MSVTKKYRVEPGKKLRLSKHDPEDTSGVRGGKAKGKEELVALSAKLDELQELLYANHDRKLLIVLQGMDTSGKDGTIRHVFDSVDPLGVRVESFKVPTSDELDRDFLWRVHMKVPRRGEIVIFNRSHYEDVLVVRVHNIVPEKIWRARYDQINAFEKLLADTGTTIVKFRRSACRRGSTTRRSNGSSRKATSQSESSGTTTRKRTKRLCSGRAPSGRRGTSCRPMRSGIGTT